MVSSLSLPRCSLSTQLFTSSVIPSLPAIRFSSSLTESAAPAPEPESAPPEDMVEGVDGEWDEEEDLEEADGLEDGEEDEMAKMMGFGGFGTSKVRLLSSPSRPSL